MRRQFAESDGGLAQIDDRAEDAPVCFASDHELAKKTQPPTFRKAMFTAAWLPDGMSLEGYTDGLLWNRWGMPKFTFEQAQRLCPHLPGLTYNAATDSFAMPQPDLWPGQKDVFAGETITVDGVAVTVYAIGAGSWCWDPPQ